MEKEIKLQAKNVETYADDMVKAIENDKGGLIKKIIHEEEKHEEEKKNLSPKSRRNRTFMFISFLLLFLAFLLFVYLTFFNKEIGTVQVAPQFTSMIFTDQNNFGPIDGFSKDKIAQTVLNEANNTKVKVGGIEGIYLTQDKKIVNFETLNTLIKGNFPIDQASLIDNNFLMGAFKSGISSVSPNIGDLFILLKVRSFSDIFPVMLKWENKILYDLHGFFGLDINSSTNYLFTKNFEDGIVSNKNARILRDKDGKIIIMYVFLTDTSILITNSEVATAEVINRLTYSQIKK